MFFFSSVNIKSAREPRFLEDIHGHFFGFTGTFSRKFTGKWLCSRALFWTFSRALFWGSRAKKIECSRTLHDVHGHIFKLKVLCSRALVNVHEHFCPQKMIFFGQMKNQSSSFLVKYFLNLASPPWLRPY